MKILLKLNEILDMLSSQLRFAAVKLQERLGHTVVCLGGGGRVCVCVFFPAISAAHMLAQHQQTDGFNPDHDFGRKVQPREDRELRVFIRQCLGEMRQKY